MSSQLLLVEVFDFKKIVKGNHQAYKNSVFLKANWKVKREHLISRRIS